MLSKNFLFMHNKLLRNITDIIILDFSKAFDTVPHQKLLFKLQSYGITGNTLDWIRNFLVGRKMRVILDGEASSETEVLSGVPQGTVLGPLLFLCHLNDLPETVTSSVRLFADDCLLYREINSVQDKVKLQEDLSHLEAWATNWGMKFNATKCYVLSVKEKTHYYYELNKTILKHVDHNPYLGVQLSSDLKWTTHVNNTAKKANTTLGFVRRNLYFCPQQCRRTAYLSLVRPCLEYACEVWDTHLQAELGGTLYRSRLPLKRSRHHD